MAITSPKSSQTSAYDKVSVVQSILKDDRGVTIKAGDDITLVAGLKRKSSYQSSKPVMLRSKFRSSVRSSLSGSFFQPDVSAKRLRAMRRVYFWTHRGEAVPG